MVISSDLEVLAGFGVRKSCFPSEILLDKNVSNMNVTSSNTLLPLSAKSAFFFYASVMLVYFMAGTFFQTSFGLLGIFLNQILWIGLPVALVAYAKNADLLDWPTWRWPGFAALLFTFIFIFGLSFIIDQLIALQDQYFPPPLFLEEFFKELTAIRSPQEGAVKLIALALTPAFCEEIFFRGLLLPSWAQKFGWLWGNIFTSLAFALAHGNLLYFHFYFILGFFMGALFKWKNSLWLPIFAHFTNNAWTLFQGN